MGLKFSNNSIKVNGKIKLDIPTPVYSGKSSSNAADSVNPYTSTGPGLNGAGITLDNITLIRQPITIPTSGLLVEYTMDNISGGTILDTSGNIHSATAINTSVISGILGNGVYFNGTNAYTSTTLSSSNNMTISYWGSLGPTGASTWNFGVSFHGSSGQNESMLDAIIASNGNLGVASGFVGFQRLNNGYAGLLNDGLWHHFLFVIDKSNYLNTHVYLDGTEISYTSGQNVTFQSDINFYINRTNFALHSDDRYAPGSIDLVRIYNRALTSTEIQTLYNEASGYL